MANTKYQASSYSSAEFCNFEDNDSRALVKFNLVKFYFRIISENVEEEIQFYIWDSLTVNTSQFFLYTSSIPC